MGADLGTSVEQRVVTMAPPAGRSDRWFFTGMAVAAALTVFIGFAQSYYLRSFSAAPSLSPLVHLHGLVFSAWILLFVAQTGLIAAGRVRVHRRLGVLGGVLAVTMLVVGLQVAIGFARAGGDPSGRGSPLGFMAIPVGDLVVFAGFVGAALYLRRRSETHKRLMLLGTISLLPPAIARMPVVGPAGIPAIFGVADLFLVACLLYDWRAHGRVHPAFVWGGLLLVLSQPLRLMVAGTGPWLAVAGWLVGI